MIHIRTMTEADLPLGMHLKTQSGWNQTEADWRRYLALQPDGCFVAELDGRAVGTTTTCIFGSVAWIAMVLVDAALRGQGIGKALMQHALVFLDSRQVPNIRLDATPLGQPLYEKLGFAPEFSLARYEGTLPVAVDNAIEEKVCQVTGAAPRQYPALCQLDCAITGTHREKLLLRLFRERPEWLGVVENHGAIQGFMTARPGTRAIQLGPCMASAEAGPELLADAWRRHAGQPAFIDIPNDNLAAVRLAKQMGLQVQRPLVRMGRGPKVGEDQARLWATFGPEMG